MVELISHLALTTMTSTSDQLRIYGQKLRDNQHSLRGTVSFLAEASKDLIQDKSKPTPTQYHQTPSHSAYNQSAHTPNPRKSRPFNGGGGGLYNPAEVVPDRKPGRLPAVYDPYGDGPNRPTPIAHSQKSDTEHGKGEKKQVWAELFGAGGEAAGGLSELFSGYGDGGGGASDGGGGGGDGGGAAAAC